MLRRIAVVGDKLDNDGEISSYNGMIFTFGGAGRQAALIDGEAYCPVCKTIGYIAKDGGPRRMTLGISEIALDQDLVICRCPEHPRIFAQLAGEAWYDDLSETLGLVSAHQTARTNAPAARHDMTEESAVFDQHFQLIDQDGIPISGALVYLRTPHGETSEARTTAAGTTPIVEGQEGDSIQLLLAYANK
jgi:hypothetical protein